MADKKKNKVTELDYESDLQINPNQLDVEWLGHPSLFMRYAEELAEAEAEAKRAHEKLKVIRSELVKEANEDPDGVLGKGIKPTAGNVEAYYRLSTQHKDAKEEFIEAEYRKDMMLNAVSAMRARKDALENMVRLHGQSYFAGPQEPRVLDSTFSSDAKGRKAASLTNRRKRK